MQGNAERQSKLKQAAIDTENQAPDETAKTIAAFVTGLTE